MSAEMLGSRLGRAWQGMARQGMARQGGAWHGKAGQGEEAKGINMKFHEVADIFPMMSSEEYESLKADIKQNGLLQPIWTHEGQIIDGRNRYNACVDLGIFPQYQTWDSAGSLVAFVVSLNLQRRHLNSSQKAMVALEVERLLAVEARERLSEAGKNFGRGMNKDEKPSQNFDYPMFDDLPKAPQLNSAQKATVAVEVEKHLVNERKASAQAAKIVGTNRQYVSDAKAIQKAAPEVAKAVVSGALNMPDAKKIATLPEEQRRVVLEKVESGEKPTKAIQEVKREEIKQHLESVEIKAVKELEGVFDVIVIDPPWPIEKIERDERPMQTKLDYPTMQIDEIKDIKIPTTDECHVWLWTTHRFLPDSFDIIKHWGLKYVCAFVWHKPGGFQPVGLPQYNCEFVLYCRKGSPKLLDTRDLPTCFNAPRGSHSEKPEEFYNFVRRVTAGRRLDMFNRRDIEGFEGWGKEAVSHSAVSHI